MDEVKTLYNKSTNERYFIEFMSAHADGYPIRLAVWVNKADGSTSQPIDISTEDEKRRFEEHKANSKIYNPPKKDCIMKIILLIAIVFKKINLKIE